MADEINLISEIRDAERMAEEMMASARDKGEAMIEKVREEYKEKTILAEREFLEERGKSLEKAALDAEKEGLSLSEDTEREIARIRSNALRKKGDAIRFLMRKVLE